MHTCRASTLGCALTCIIIKIFTRQHKLLPSAPIYQLFKFIPEKVQELVLQKESISISSLVGAKMPDVDLYTAKGPFSRQQGRLCPAGHGTAKSD